jgi:chromosome segregation ATPase
VISSYTDKAVARGDYRPNDIREVKNSRKSDPEDEIELLRAENERLKSVVSTLQAQSRASGKEDLSKRKAIKRLSHLSPKSKQSQEVHRETEAVYKHKYRHMKKRAKHYQKEAEETHQLLTRLEKERETDRTEVDALRTKLALTTDKLETSERGRKSEASTTRRMKSQIDFLMKQNDRKDEEIYRYLKEREKGANNLENRHLHSRIDQMKRLNSDLESVNEELSSAERNQRNIASKQKEQATKQENEILHLKEQVHILERKNKSLYNRTNELEIILEDNLRDMDFEIDSEDDDSIADELYIKSSSILDSSTPETPEATSDKREESPSGFRSRQPRRNSIVFPRRNTPSAA